MYVDKYISFFDLVGGDVFILDFFKVEFCDSWVEFKKKGVFFNLVQYRLNDVEDDSIDEELFILFGESFEQYKFKKCKKIILGLVMF